MDLVDKHSQHGFDCVCGNLRMAARAITSMYDRHLQPAGLRASQMAVLWAVAAMRMATIKDIAVRIAMDETTLVRNLRVLERRGWVSIQVGADRRQRLVDLTAEGRAVFAAALPLWKQAQKQIDAGLKSGVEDVNRTLLRLVRAAG
jgi:DNA-binding MarR family transcriptional regulator